MGKARFSPLAVGVTIAAVAAATLGRWGLEVATGEPLPAFITFYPALALVALFFGPWMGVLATVLSALSVDYFFMGRPFSLGVDTTGQAVSLTLFTAAGMIVSLIAGRRDVARRREVEAIERARVQEELARHAAETERQRQLLAVTLASIGDAVIVTDVAGRVTFLNDEAVRLTGWTNADAAGQPLPEVFRIINEHTRAVVESPVDKVLRLGTVVGLANHTVLIAKDGREIPIDDSGAPIRQINGAMEGVVLVFRDFTERKAAERALVRAKEEWERTFDSVPDLIAIMDEGHRIVRANAAMAKRLGRTPDECAGAVCHECVHGLDHPPVFCPHAKTMRDGQPHEAEVNEPRLGGHFLVTTTPLLDETGRLMGTVHVARDITERKRAEDALVAARHSAEQAKGAAEHANNAKDHFLAVLSHELRTPLAPVLVTADMMEKDPELPERYREDVEMIRRNVELEARLIDDLLDITRIARGKLELHRKPVNVAEVLGRAVEVCRVDLGARGQELELDLPANGDCTVEADAARLQQVFWNLLKNAIKFTPRGGRVGVHVRTLGTAMGDGAAWVAVEVWDNGVGITPEILPHIFNAFEQGGVGTTRQFGGLGLGLTITKGLVEMHGGSVEAHSEGWGKGAKFVVKLPLIAAGQAAEKGDLARRNLAAALAARVLRILLVEDHGDTARVMRRLLAAQGHEVLVAGDVATALELAGRLEGGEFDLMISDLGLPDGSGFELLRQLRSRGQVVPAIALSGYGQEQDVQRSREAGFATHLTKPISPERLVAAIALVTG